MPIEASYLGMKLTIGNEDIENRTYFGHCAQGRYHLQRCSACSLLRYPPGPSCYWCGSPESHWDPVSPTGTVHSYTEVHHAIQPGFKAYAPYAVLIVDLDEQRGHPTADEALRVVGNLVAPDGALAGPALVRQVGIGSVVEMTFTRLSAEIALPNWTLKIPDGSVPWRAGVDR
jgi:uncharacterized OB-fold protein